MRDGLVESLAHPEGNLTGVFGARDEVDKQLEMYQRVVPNLRRLLTLIDPTDKRTERLLKDAQGAVGELRRPLELDLRKVTTAKDIERVFRSLRPGEVDGVFLLSPSLRLNHTAQTIELANKARLPVQAHRKEWVEQGALFSYGIDLPLIGRESARATSTASSRARRHLSSPSTRSRSSSSRSTSRPRASSGSSRSRR